MNSRSLGFVSLLLLLIASVAGAQTASADATLFFAELRGSNEVPATPSTVVGSALVTIDSNNLLTYELNAAGIQNPTASHIHKAAAGVNAGVFVGFPGTFSNGRLRGTIQLTQAQADDIRSNPAGFYANLHTTAFGGGEIRGQLAAATEYDIAIAGNVTTGAGDKFVSDLRVFNPSFTSRAVVLVEYFISGSAANANATASRTVEIPPRGEAVLDDVTAGGGLNSPGSIGALRVTSNRQLAITSNIYNDQRGAGRGTFGQFVPAVTRASALQRGVIPHLSNRARDLANPTGFRTNIGFFNPNQSLATVTLTLRDSSGTVLGTNTLTLAGLSQQQNAITTYFPGVDLSNASALTLSFESTMPIHAYGAVNDNASGDSILVMAQLDVAP